MWPVNLKCKFSSQRNTGSRSNFGRWNHVDGAVCSVSRRSLIFRWRTDTAGPPGKVSLLLVELKTSTFTHYYYACRTVGQKMCWAYNFLTENRHPLRLHKENSSPSDFRLFLTQKQSLSCHKFIKWFRGRNIMDMMAVQSGHGLPSRGNEKDCPMK